MEKIKRFFCKHDYRPYCYTETKEQFEKLPYELRKIREKNMGISAEYKESIWAAGVTKVCIKCGKKKHKWNSPEEIHAEVNRLEKLGLKTNDPMLKA